MSFQGEITMITDTMNGKIISTKNTKTKVDISVSSNTVTITKSYGNKINQKNMVFNMNGNQGVSGNGEFLNIDFNAKIFAIRSSFGSGIDYSTIENGNIF